jgi:hypothetical protein
MTRTFNCTSGDATIKTKTIGTRHVANLSIELHTVDYEPSKSVKRQLERLSVWLQNVASKLP